MRHMPVNQTNEINIKRILQTIVISQDCEGDLAVIAVSLEEAVDAAEKILRLAEAAEAAA